MLGVETRHDTFMSISYKHELLKLKAAILKIASTMELVAKQFSLVARSRFGGQSENKRVLHHLEVMDYVEQRAISVSYDVKFMI